MSSLSLLTNLMQIFQIKPYNQSQTFKRYEPKKTSIALKYLHSLQINQKQHFCVRAILKNILANLILRSEEPNQTQNKKQKGWELYYHFNRKEENR